MPGLTKRPKLSSTPPLSALGRLAEAAVAEKRAISPSIKEPSVVPIEGKDGLWTSPSPCVIRAPGFRKAPSRLSSVGSLENGEQESAVSLFFRACLLGPPSPHLCFRLSVTRGAYVTQGRWPASIRGPKGLLLHARLCGPPWGADSRAGASGIGKPCTDFCWPSSGAGAGVSLMPSWRAACSCPRGTGSLSCSLAGLVYFPRLPL